MSKLAKNAAILAIFLILIVLALPSNASNRAEKIKTTALIEQLVCTPELSDLEVLAYLFPELKKARYKGLLPEARKLSRRAKRALRRCR